MCVCVCACIYVCHFYFFSSLSRVLEPTVLLEMTLSDGRIHTFNVSI